MDPEYEDEVQFFFDVLEDFLEKDYNINSSLKLSKNAAKYYVSPTLYDYLIEMCSAEIDAASKLEDELSGVI